MKSYWIASSVVMSPCRPNITVSHAISFLIDLLNIVQQRMHEINPVRVKTYLYFLFSWTCHLLWAPGGAVVRACLYFCLLSPHKR